MKQILSSFIFPFFALILVIGLPSGCIKSKGKQSFNANNTNNTNMNNQNNVDPVCGNGQLETGEACDDGNTQSGDGCSSDCSEVEPTFACPVPGELCVQIVICGNRRIEGDETCDDGNTTSGDGCSATCQVEPGWICPVMGAACIAARCGDGIMAGFETCDDGNTLPNDGCSPTCRLEEGWHCEGTNCFPTICGDGIVQGTEECDDGNLEVGDGCSPITCKREPDCTDGVCVAVCGDGVIWPPEECDDGNTISGDGCSADCKIEPGWYCVESPPVQPNLIYLPVTLRDFIPGCSFASRPTDQVPGAVPPYGHPDFECYTGDDIMYGNVQSQLDADRKPVRVPNSVTFSNDSFHTWFRSHEDYNRTLSQLLTLVHQGGGVYRFESSSYFPLDNLGWITETCNGSPCEIHMYGHNFAFTTEIRYWFEYRGNEILEFTGDDDVWVFINNRLAVDVGGVHPVRSGSVNLGNPTVAQQLGLTIGGIYEAVVFHAERHTDNSNYMLTLTNFDRSPSICHSECGDGIVASNEACDDGENTGEYGTCNPDCSFAPYCGDGIVQDNEECDDGINLGGNASACSPDCQSYGGYCGDGIVQLHLGEQCDNGTGEAGNGCTADCRIYVD